MLLALLLACADPESCTSPASWYAPSCTDDTLVEGCYTSCDGEEGACDAGTCTLVGINPCAGSECDACGAETWLCL